MNHLKSGTAFFGQGSYKSYKYNSKELQETGMYSYGWRDYMPDIGRWNGIDQLAEKYLSTSTYTYVANNPVSNADVDGRWFNDDGSIDTSGTANGFVRTRSYSQSYLGQNSQQGGGSAEVIAKMLALGGDWYNTGYGFAGTAKIGLAYDGSYTSLNTDLDSYINIPEITLSGSSFFWGLQAQNQFNSYTGSWNSKSDFAYSRASCGHCNDGPIKMIGGAGDPAGIYDIAGQVISTWEPENRNLAMGVGIIGAVALKKPALAKADAYAGVKEASLYLQSAGVPRAYRKQILESFEIETISLKTAGKSTYGIRFYGGAAKESGRYLFPSFDGYINRTGLALPPSWNSMSNFSQFRITPGTNYIFGRAASQGGIYTGGSYQMYVNDLKNLIK